MNYLTENVLPFWLKNSIDYKNGGIFTCIDEDGSIYDTEKSVWFQGRALYIFSLAYNDVEKNPEYLKAAKAIFDFLPKCEVENGRMAFTVTESGEYIQKRRYYFSETFAAIGCAEYYIATGDEKAKFLAEKYFDIAYKIYNNPNLETPKFNPVTTKFHSLSPAMILLSTAQILRKINKDKYNEVAKLMVNKIKLHITEFGLIENVDLNGNFVNTSTGRIINPGHALEAAWFLMAEGQYQNDSELLDLGKIIIEKAMNYGFRNGGIIAFCDCLGKPPKALEWDMYLWWPQCEAMIANFMAYKIFGDEKYLTDYNKIKEFAFKNFSDNVNGEWYGYLHYDKTVANKLKGNIFKGPFHLPRMLILIDKLENNKFIF